MAKKINPIRYTDDGKILISGSLDKLPKYCTYSGNKLIKKADIVIEYTQEQIEILVKCATDIVWFAEHFVTIVDANIGKTLVKLRPYQKKLLEHYMNNRFSCVLSSRQSGKSTITAIFILHYILFNKDKKAAIIANKAAIAKEIFAKVRIAYERLPFWLQCGVIEWQKTSCTLENGSNAFSVATTPEGIRGLSAQLVLMDEFAFIRHNIAEEFISGVYPTISAATDSRIIMVSTPKGFNHFYEFYNKAVKKTNNFKHFRVDWWEVEGRDEAWKEETIRNIGKVRFASEYGNEFSGSTYTLIPNALIEKIETREPLTTDLNGFLKIYEQPRLNHIYVLGVDTSKGTGRDSSVTQVLDITNYPFRQVATYRNNQINTIKYAGEVLKIAERYNKAYIMVENNDIGEAVVNYLWNTIEYDNLVCYGKKNEVGIRSTKKTKPQAAYLLRDLIETGQLELLDIETVYELSKFTELREGVFGAEEGENDDCVMALVWACFILKTNYLDHEINEKTNTEELDDEDIKNDEPVDPVISSYEQDTDDNWMVA